MSTVSERLRERAQDPVLVSCWVAAGLIVAAFAVFGLAWRGTAATLSIPVQLSYLVSGCLGGMSLLLAGAALLTVQLGRRFEAQERQALVAVLDEARAALESVTAAGSRSQER